MLYFLITKNKTDTLILERRNSENSPVGIVNLCTPDPASPECCINGNNDSFVKIDDNESKCHTAVIPSGLSSSNKPSSHSRHSSCSDSANVHLR